MVRHNNVIPNVHLRKHWAKYVRTWFNQPARKRRRLEARREKAANLFPRPAEYLRPVVRQQTIKYNRKLRSGRGFTLEEIKATKLGVAFARSIGIAVDHRRKNRSNEAFQANVKRLQDYKQQLVLFPRHSNKPKKGLINDATEAEVKQFGSQQKDINVVLPLPEPKLREKAVKITKELTGFKAYRTLRQERTNAYYVGKRQKRAQEAQK